MSRNSTVLWRYSLLRDSFTVLLMPLPSLSFVWLHVCHTRSQTETFSTSRIWVKSGDSVPLLLPPISQICYTVYNLRHASKYKNHSCSITAFRQDRGSTMFRNLFPCSFVTALVGMSERIFLYCADIFFKPCLHFIIRASGFLWRLRLVLQTFLINPLEGCFVGEYPR